MSCQCIYYTELNKKNVWCPLAINLKLLVRYVATGSFVKNIVSLFIIVFEEKQ